MKKFSIMKDNENSIFIWSSHFAKSFNEMTELTNDMITVITNAHYPDITIYNVKDFTENEIMKVIKTHCSYLNFGNACNYKFIKKTGNCYFIN